ncbi:MAG: glycosyltransferase family 2 protein [Lachnospiraceae bacterium]|nr:glycosyltransferase family 2 protein [Lachnospiraceae bacterium]
MKVSIIIPVYKAEKYIKRCVDSVLAQEYKDLEIILVDDGSPDNCNSICDDYARKDERVKVIHKKNEGVSKARNSGLEQITGDYVQFVDSDDYLKPQMTKMLVEAMEREQADLVVCGFMEDNLNFSRISKMEEKPGIYKKEQILENITRNPYSLHYGVLWNKLFRAEHLKKHLYFQAHMNFGEDFIFNLHYLKYAKKIAVIEEPLYFYVRYNEDSLMYQQTKKKEELHMYMQYLEKRLLLFQKYRDFYKEEGLYQCNCNAINSYLLKVYVSEKLELRTLALNKQEKKQCIKYLENNKEIKAMKAEMSKWYYYKMSLRYFLGKCKVLLRNHLVKN